MINNKNLRSAIVSYNTMQSFIDEIEKLILQNVDDRGQISAYRKLVDEHREAFERHMKNFIEEVIYESYNKEA